MPAGSEEPPAGPGTRLRVPGAGRDRACPPVLTLTGDPKAQLDRLRALLASE